MSKSFSKLQVTSFLLLLSAGCASSYRAPESVEQKMARYEPQGMATNLVPELPTANISKASKAGRTPASVSVEKPEESSADLQHSNKRLYFLTLFSQYQELDGKGRELNICPHFHSQLIDHSASYRAQNSSFKTIPNYSAQLIENILKDETLLAQYPEFALPMTETNLRPRVIDVLAKAPADKREELSQVQLERALKVHSNKTYAELAELCEYGSSDNYYIFENMVAHMNRNKNSPRPEQLRILLKSSLMFNHALVQSLKGQQTKAPSRAPASAEATVAVPYTFETLKRLNAAWSQEYFKTVGKSF